MNTAAGNCTCRWSMCVDCYLLTYLLTYLLKLLCGRRFLRASTFRWAAELDVVVSMTRASSYWWSTRRWVHLLANRLSRSDFSLLSIVVFKPLNLLSHLLLALLAASSAYSIGDWCICVWMCVIKLILKLLQFFFDSHETWYTPSVHQYTFGTFPKFWF